MQQKYFSMILRLDQKKKKERERTWLSFFSPSTRSLSTSHVELIDQQLFFLLDETKKELVFLLIRFDCILLVDVVESIVVERCCFLCSFFLLLFAFFRSESNRSTSKHSIEIQSEFSLLTFHNGFHEWSTDHLFVSSNKRKISSKI